MENLLINMLGLKLNKSVSKKEMSVLEIVINTQIFHSLRAYFNSSLNAFSADDTTEGRMVDGALIRRLANDLITNEDYSIVGLAQYTGFPAEVIFDVVSGINHNPTIVLANKILELHIAARRELYMSFLKNITKLDEVIKLN